MAGTDDNPIEYPELVMPDSVTRREATVWSLGLALDADVYRPRDLEESDSVPGVVLSHGIGGDKMTCERYAALFAEAGMIAVTFTQASWGQSQGRLQIDGLHDASLFDGEVHQVGVSMVRELIDPLEWVDCYRSVVDFLVGEPNVDGSRIGAWGTSFGGGSALSVAATDARVRALSIQVPAVFNPPEPMEQLGASLATQIARGEIAPIPQGEPTLPNLKGTPHIARMASYRPGDLVNQLSVPTLILDAQNEEMFDITDSGGAAYKKLQERGIDSYYEVLPNIDHYGIYFGGFDRGSQLSLDWFERYL